MGRHPLRAGSAPSTLTMYDGGSGNIQYNIKGKGQGQLCLQGGITIAPPMMCAVPM